MRPVFVVLPDIFYDLLNGRLFGTPDPALDHVSGKDVEPDFYLVQPGCIRGGEMKCQSPPFFHPREDIAVLMSAQIVSNDMQAFPRIRAIEMFKEIQEIFMPCAVHAPAVNSAVMHGQGRQ